MPLDTIPHAVNQDFEPIVNGALSRVRQLLPPQFELFHTVLPDELRVRGDARALENMLVSACLMAWQSMMGVEGGTAIVVDTGEVVMDEIVLNTDAEQLQGGLPPRRFVQVQVASNLRLPPGPLHIAVQAGAPQPVSAHRLKLVQMRQVVLDHKGTFSVSSDPARGSAFDIYLPAAPPLERSAISDAGNALRHVLYVDDYPDMRDLVAEVLPDAGFRVTCVECAVEALALLRARPQDFDALVTDFKLPDYSGVELLKPALELHPGLPAIVISGYVDELLRTRAHAQGAAAVLSKSEDIDELVRMLRELLQATPNPAAGSFTDWASL